VSILAAVFTGTLIFSVLYNTFLSELKKGVKNDAAYIQTAMLISPDDAVTVAEKMPYTNDLCRITLLAKDGTVLYDNTTPPAAMENHIGRPEILSALQYGAGQALRFSNTIQKQTYYYAVMLNDSVVLRVSRTTESVWGALVHCLLLGLLIIPVITIAAAMLAGSRTRRIVGPINALDLENPLANDTYEELSPLLGRIERQNRQIKTQMSQLRKKQDEFYAITDNMREGLILLDENSFILSINRSACSLFSVNDKSYISRHILTIERSLDWKNAIEQASRGVHSEALLEKNDRYYQVLASPVFHEGALASVVLLIVDITEKHMAEQMRKEFTANVSHELKTPLQSICGYAEIINNGLVKAKDVPRFIDRIHSESRRLITLVEDIIRLSRLDEGGEELPKESVDLLRLAQETAKRLEPVAQERGVTVTVQGENAEVFGVRQLLGEMLYNLCDNAIKYNNPNGSVSLSVRQTGDAVLLEVEDTGIGIPKEHQSRVFERFYRVDKSHSKETGGTGLGLSIVKHAALFHHAQINLESSVGIGTIITVSFPKSDSRAK
jgi:two-component system phosphate regulon sensor histidine kinase PhoR